MANGIAYQDEPDEGGESESLMPGIVVRILNRLRPKGEPALSRTSGQKLIESAKTTFASVLLSICHLTALAILVWFLAQKLKIEGLFSVDAYRLWIWVAIIELPLALCFVEGLASLRTLKYRGSFLQPVCGPSYVRFKDEVLTRMGLEPKRQTQAALRFWASEQGKVGRARERFEFQTRLYGVLVSGVLNGCLIAIVSCGDFSLFPLHMHTISLIACTVASAALVNFAQGFGQLVVRAAKRDISSKMMAVASSNLLLVVLSGAVLEALVIQNQPRNEHPVFLAILTGVLAAFLGERALALCAERLGALFNIKFPQPDPSYKLSNLEGVSERDACRLQEEGIDSIHSFAFASIPRLFFQTHYSLARLCAWQNQALLIARVGPDRAKLWNTTLGISGILSAQELAWEYLAADEEKQSEWCQRLGFSQVEQAKVMLLVLARDEFALRLGIYNGAVLQDPVHSSLDKAAPTPVPG